MTTRTAPKVEEDVAEARQIAPALMKLTKAEVKALAAWWWHEAAVPDKVLAKAVRRLDEWEARKQWS